MNSKELAELLDYIQENNSWENMWKLLDKDRYCFKYVRIDYDTRENMADEDHVWHVTLDNGKDQRIFLRDKTLEECKAVLDLPRKEIMKLFAKEK